MTETDRVAFVGAENVGKATLERLFDTGLNIVGVITASEKLRDEVADWVSFDDLLAERDIDYHEVLDSNTQEFVDIIEDIDPSVIFVISWSFIIPSEVIDRTENGVVGLHYSLLPERRGGAPLNWALIDGLEKSGVTLFYLSDDLDEGDIIAQREFDIAPDDTVRDLLDKVVEISPELVAEYAEDIVERTAPRKPQDDSKATYTPARSPEDSRIDWDQSVEDIYNFVRALTPPYPPAFTVVDGYRMVIPSARFDGERMEIEVHFEPSEEPQSNSFTLQNTELTPAEPVNLATVIRERNHREPIEINAGSRTVELTHAMVEGGALHAEGIVR